MLSPLRLLLSGFLIASASSAAADVLYVSSFGTGEVFRYEAGTGAFIDTFVSAADGSGLVEPHGVLDRGSDVLVASAANDRVLRYDRQSGDLLGEFLGPASGVDYPVALVEGPDGALYVSSQLSDEVLKFDAATGASLGAFVTAGSGGLDGPSGMAFGPDGRLYVASRYGGAVLAYDGATGAFDGVIADASDGLGAGDTFGLAFGGNGDLYFASAGALYRYDLETESITATAATGFPIGVEAAPDDPSGGVVAATGNNLRRMDGVSDTLGAPLLGPGATIGTLNFFHYSRFATVNLPGDYNGDGTVDAADYTAWRDSLDGGGALMNDITPSVSEGDYAVWADNYGATSPPAATAVPEPSTALTLGLLLSGYVARRSRAYRSMSITTGC